MTDTARDGILLRRLLLAVLLLGMAGLGTELLLLEHTEEAVQVVPLALLGVGVVLALVVAARPRRGALLVLRGLMLLFVFAGAVGMLLHYRGNVEFEHEMYPTLAGTALFRKAMQGATPALAPGALAQLGLLGLLYTWRHPGLRGTSDATRNRGA